jgi:3-phytase
MKLESKFVSDWCGRGAFEALTTIMSLALPLPAMAADPLYHVTASVETQPVPNNGDAADDAAFWVHPTDTSLSTIIGTDKLGGVAVYDLAGKQLSYRADGKLNNIDIRYNFPLAGKPTTIVAASNRSNDSISVYTVDPSTRALENIAARTISTGITVYGLCMYRSASTNKYYVFVNGKDGNVQQWELFEIFGKVDAKNVRSLSLRSQTEGCVADDKLGHFYIGEEEVAIWKYGAEPTAGTTHTRVDGVGGHIAADIEGLSIYYAADGQGYLIASSQGNNRYVVYERAGTNAYVVTFDIIASAAIDGTTETDGIDVTSFALGDTFPEGAFIAQDGSDDGNQNFKLVPWTEIARTGPGLRIDTSQDPRR